MRFSYVVTFEFDEARPETVRGKLEVANARLGVRRAVEAAQKEKPHRHWRSLVVVLDRPDILAQAAAA